jgi:hypothetical protein
MVLLDFFLAFVVAGAVVVDAIFIRRGLAHYTFSERVAEVRDSPNSLNSSKILSHHHDNGNVGWLRLKSCCDMEIYNWDGQTLCPRTDYFSFDASF